MSALARRLAGLRRQAGAPAADTGVPATGTIAARPAHALSAHAPPARAHAAGHDATIAQLRRLLHLQPKAAVRHIGPLDRALHGEEIAPGLRYLEASTPWPRSGPCRLEGIGQGIVDRERLLAFDTETTGLAGGTGTRAFMIGAADWHAGRLRLRQLYITALSAEVAMLREALRWIAADTVLVSYNGKSYDRPLLSTRLRLARLPDPLPDRQHIDLLHPMRRRYREVWPNCRLATAERQLLGVVREDDLPGSEAPAAWLTYLRGGSAVNLRRVCHHNAQDLRSLCGLLDRLADPDPDLSPD